MWMRLGKELIRRISRMCADLNEWKVICANRRNLWIKRVLFTTSSRRRNWAVASLLMFLVSFRREWPQNSKPSPIRTTKNMPKHNYGRPTIILLDRLHLTGYCFTYRSKGGTDLCQTRQTQARQSVVDFNIKDGHMETQGTLLQPTCARNRGLWFPVNRDIDMNRLAELCRFIAGLAPRQFNAIADVIGDCKRLFEPAACSPENKTCQDRDADLPLVSIGPSGIGGRFQREMK